MSGCCNSSEPVARRKLGHIIGAIVLMFAVPAIAQTPRIVSPAADDIALTIYRDNLAFVTETRSVDIPAGRSTIAFEGVSDLMIAQTAILREFGAISLERNFDYDLLSQGSLFKNSVGRKVFLTRTNPATGAPIEEEATILTAGQGVVMNIGGRIETFDCSGLPEKISFDGLPENLISQPTLSIEVSADEAGPQEFTISYLASGFDWQADYILRLSDDQQTADMSGWLTVTNGTAVSVKNAPTAIVAGELQRLWETRAEQKYADGFYAACWPKGSTKTGTYYPQGAANKRFRAAAAPVMARAEFAQDSFAVEEEVKIVVTGSSIAQREDLGDYKLFRTPEPTTVAAYQTKQVLFLAKTGIEVSRIHAFDLDPDIFFDVDPEDEPEIEAAILRYDIDNKKDGKLAQPLPEGSVRIFMPDQQGSIFYLGEDDIRDLAVGLPVEVAIADSPSVSISTNVTSSRSRDLTNGDIENTVILTHRVSNANSYLVTVEISQNKDGYAGPIKISRASRRQIKDSAYPKWQFDVAPNSDATLSYMMVWVD